MFYSHFHGVYVLRSNEDVLDAEVPFFCTRLTPNTAYDWNYTTSPQTALNGREIAYPRGYILGGSSSVSKSNVPTLSLSWYLFIISDYMAYTRGSSEDFDRHARITGDDGWSWNNIQSYIRKVKSFQFCQSDKF